MEEQKKTSSAMTIVLSIILTAVLFGGGGFLYGQNIQVDNSDDIATPTATGDIAVTTPAINSSVSTTYTNSKFGFNFQIPSGYSLMEEYQYEGGEGVGIRIGKTGENNISEFAFLTLNYIKEGSSYDEFLKNTKEESDIKNDILGTSEITISGQKAEKIEVGGFSTGYTVLTARGNENLNISSYPNTDENEELMDKIIATFRFSE